MSPPCAGSCRLHGPAFLGTQEALRVNTEDACPAQPITNGHLNNAVARLRKEQWDASDV